MTASPVQATAAHGVRRVGLSEWLGMRRPPHPEFIHSLDALPDTLATLARAALPSGQRSSGALLLPAEYYTRKMLAWEYVPERALIFLDGAALYVRAEGPETAAQTVLLDSQSLLYVRSSLLLLYGLLEFKANCGPQTVDVRLEYNTVIWRALRDPLGQFVSKTGPTRPIAQGPAVKPANEAMLATLPYKFANGVRYYSLEPGECLDAVVFQPAIWVERSLFPRQVTPNTLFVLTDAKVVLIEESRSLPWRRKPSQGEYGWIFTFIPHDRVTGMVVTPRDGLAELRLTLEWGAAREARTLLLEPEVARRWEEAWQTADRR
jgi:hypothetical protein